MPTIRLRRRAYHDACFERELFTPSAQARAMGITPSSVWRVMESLSLPGVPFIAGALRAFPDLTFADLFEIVDDDPPAEVLAGGQELSA